VKPEDDGKSVEPHAFVPVSACPPIHLGRKCLPCTHTSLISEAENRFESRHALNGEIQDFGTEVEPIRPERERAAVCVIVAEQASQRGTIEYAAGVRRPTSAEIAISLYSAAKPLVGGKRRFMAIRPRIRALASRVTAFHPVTHESARGKVLREKQHTTVPVTVEVFRAEEPRFIRAEREKIGVPDFFVLSNPVGKGRCHDCTSFV
jgi:hypothetical protein